MSKRARGEGSVFKSKDGTWRGFVTVGVDANGKQVKRWFRGQKRAAVAAKVAAARSLAGSGLATNSGRVTVSEWLTRFVRQRSTEVRPRTKENYQHYLSKIEPAIGHRLMRAITPFHVQDLYLSLADEGLSPSVRQHVHHFRVS